MTRPTRNEFEVAQRLRPSSQKKLLTAQLERTRRERMKLVMELFHSSID